MPDREAWFKLCEQAAIEEDPQRLFELVRQINHLLELKLQRLKNAGQPCTPEA